MPTLGQAATFNTLSYLVTSNSSGGFNTAPTSSTQAAPTIPDGWRIADVSDHTGAGGSGAYAVVFVNDTTGQAYVAARGTTASALDIDADIGIALGQKPIGRINDQVNLVNSLKANYEVSGGGHSLGAAEMAAVSAQTGVPVLLQNAPLNPDSFEGEFGATKAVEIQTQNDIVGNVGTDTPQNITMDASSAIDQFNTHSVDTQDELINGKRDENTGELLRDKASPLSEQELGQPLDGDAIKNCGVGSCNQKTAGSGLAIKHL